LNNTEDVNILNDYQENALMVACLNKNTNIETVKILLENGADLNIQDEYGFTTLMKSCRKSNKNYNEELLRLLFDYDPYYMQVNALMYLCNELPNRIEMVKLLKSKSNLYHRNQQNETITDLCLKEYKCIFKKF
jgi:ankyrin repeat protein